MNTVSLIAISKDSLENEVVDSAIELRSTYFEGKIPSHGLTFLPDVAAFQLYSSQFMTKKPTSILTTNYVGTHADPTLRVHGPDDLKNATFLDLTKASQDLKVLISEHIDKVLAEDKYADTLQHLLDLELAKYIYRTQIFTKRSPLLQILGQAPELIERILDIPELSHIDAIRFRGYEKNKVIELVTIFSDEKLIYQNNREDYLVASITKMKDVKVKCPTLIQKAEKRINLESLKAMQATQTQTKKSA